MKKINHKKLTVTLFDNDVKIKNNTLCELQKRHDDLEKIILSELDSTLVSQPMDEVMQMMTSLPLKNLKDLHDQQKGKRFSISKAILFREKVLKANKFRNEELTNLKNQIEIAKIDVALAKVNSVLDSINK